MSDSAEDPTYGPVTGLLSAVMASCGDAIIACSVEGLIEAWSQSAEDVYGYTRSEAVGKTLDLIVPPERTAEIKRIADAATEGEATEPFDTVRVRRSGEAFPASVCAFPVRDDDGEYAGLVVIEKEVSGLVRSADELRKALSAAEAASSAKSRFLANASHELRTPMNAIVGMTALALEEEISPELRDYLETIRDSSDSMLHLINDVLDLSKFESERFELDETTFDPRELVEGTIKVLGAAAHAKGLELVCRVTPETPVGVIGDPIRLRQVLTNLVGNAIKFTAAGEVVVEVEPISIEKKRCKLSFRVVDSGIGISAEDQDRIFTPFTQVDGATTRRYAGTGLGLTITQHLIDCFGGELNVTSTPGEGSTFSFDLTFPLADEADDEAALAAAARLRGLSVLVVDDNEASRTALMEQFRAWEMKPTAASSGREALDRLADESQTEHRFDLAVIDALMPGIDGFSVAARIESDERITAKPILMASTTDRLEFSRRCAEAGAAAFVQKPVSQSQLLGAVVQATGAATLGGETRQGLFQRPQVSPLRVLLVEDTPANRKVVQRVLTKRGHRLDMAVNGREAVDTFRIDVYDVVLMDIQMPIMDGFQATEAIREIERAADRAAPVPIVAMTAHTMRGDRERCLRAGMDGYLSKPLDLQKLIEVVEAHAAPGPIIDRAAVTSAEKTTPILPDGEAKVGAADLSTALQRLRGDRGLLIDMIGFYLEDAPTLTETLRAAIDQQDLAEVQRAAHSLKGLSATFDAHAAVAAARDIEVASRDGRTESLAAANSRLAQEINRLSQQLTAYRESESIG